MYKAMNDPGGITPSEISYREAGNYMISFIYGIYKTKSHRNRQQVGGFWGQVGERRKMGEDRRRKVSERESDTGGTGARSCGPAGNGQLTSLTVLELRIRFRAAVREEGADHWTPPRPA